MTESRQQPFFHYQYNSRSFNRRRSPLAVGCIFLETLKMYYSPNQSVESLILIQSAYFEGMKVFEMLNVAFIHSDYLSHLIICVQLSPCEIHLIYAHIWQDLFSESNIGCTPFAPLFYDLIHDHRYLANITHYSSPPLPAPIVDEKSNTIHPYQIP